MATRPLEDRRSVARRRLVRLLHRELRLDAFFEAANGTLASLMPFDSSCWLSLDPGTLLPTGHFTWQVDSHHLLELAANEYLEDDVNKFAALAACPRPVGILSAATGGDLGRSPRYVRLLATHGYRDGDELRATFLDGDAAWGCVAVHRRRGCFTDAEAGVVGDVGPYLASGIRRAILRTALELQGEPEPPGLVVLSAGDSVESMTPPMHHWLDELFDSTRQSADLPLLLASIAHHARRAAAGRTDEVASVRLPRRSGGWLRLDASVLGEPNGRRVAVIVSAAREPEVADLIVAMYGLSKREREVAGLTLRGRSTDEMAALLHVSAYTVQDHLKSIFDKVGVRSRRQLMAQLFLQQSAPRLGVGAPLRSDGWFADAAPTRMPD